MEVTKFPNRAEIRCNNKQDEHVQQFLELYARKLLPTEVIVEERDDIDVKLYLDEELLDNIGLPHKG